MIQSNIYIFFSQMGFMMQADKSGISTELLIRYGIKII